MEQQMGTGHRVLAAVEELNDEYYYILEKLCRRAEERIISFQQLSSESEFAGVCEGWVSEVGAFIRERQAVYVPYFNELSEKSTSGHDCSTCSGKCDVQHAVKVIEFTASARRVSDSTAQFQNEVSMMLKRKERIEEPLLALRGKVALIANLVEELVNKEIRNLVPMIHEAQKKINVSN